MTATVERSQVLRFGVFEVDRRARELRRQGVRVRLQEQPFQVLLQLLEHAGDVVTREDLRVRLWPASVYVDFDHGLNNSIAKLREALGDSSATPHFIETVPRLGYRFIYPLRDESMANGPAGTVAVNPVESVSDDPLPPQTVAPVTWFERIGLSHRLRPRVVLIVAIAVAVVVLGGVVGSRVEMARPPDAVSARSAVPEEPSLRREPSIAVLPFANLSSDAENEHFADGLSEELISKLAGIEGLNVAGRTSSFYFKAKPAPAAVVARTLNVNHLLEGSVRRSGSRLRITVQLIDASNGYHVWSQSFDRDMTDIFQIHEDIARNVASALQVKLLGADELQLRKHPTHDIEAYKLYLFANHQIAGKTDWNAVKQAYEAAIERDPKFAAAYAGLAYYYYYLSVNSLADVENGTRDGWAAAQHAVTADPESSEALGARGAFEFWRYRSRGDAQAYERAHQDFRRALELNPSNARARGFYGIATQWNEPELALSLFESAYQIDPLEPTAVGMGALVMSRQGHHDQARQQLRAFQERGVAVHAAILEKYLGRLDEAVRFQREAMSGPELGLRLQLWALYMSLGDREAARQALDMGTTSLAKVLAASAHAVMDGDYEDAFELLDTHRGEFPESRVLDLPAARFALITGRADLALTILEQRLPDLAADHELVSARNVLPALDLVAARLWTGRQAAGSELLENIVAFLDGPSAPRLPMFVYLLARAQALAGKPELAQQALDRAYETGFRTTWALDLTPQPLLYIDPIERDPVFAALRLTPRYRDWLERIKADNERQRARLAERDASKS